MLKDLHEENARLREQIAALQRTTGDELHLQPGLLSAVLDASVAAVAVLDPDGRILFANPSAEGILGLQASEIVERRYNDPDWRATSPDGSPWPDDAHPFVRVMGTGEPVYNVRHAIEWPDGQRKQLAINGAPIKDEAGQITQLVFSIADVTEQYAQEQKLRESNAWLNLALEAGGMGLWNWNVQTGEVRWSADVGALFGLAPEEFEGTLEAYKRLVHPEDLHRLEEALGAALAGESETYWIVHRLIRRDGSVRWVEGRGRVLTAADGAAREIIGTVVDVTPQKEVELALRNSEEAFRTLLETVPSYIVSLGRDRRIRMLNRARPPATVGQLIGRNVLDFLPESYRETYTATLDKVFETGELQEYEGSADTPEGETNAYLIRMGPERKDGEVVSVTVVAIDITELKRAEAALRESQEQLRHAQRLESVGRLAGGVAHDFNNLLTVVIGCADLLATRVSEDAKVQEPIHTIRDAAQRGAALTRQLLAFASKQVVQPQVLDLNRCAQDAERLLRSLLGADVELSLGLEQDLWPVEMDAGQFEQILINLAVNARDAMPGGGRLCIRTTNVPSTGESTRQDAVRVTVEDEGAGIPPELLPLLFEPFFTTKAAGMGTGLGLSTCFGIVNQAGGTIEVMSEVGAGAAFHVLLPRADADVATSVPQGGSPAATPVVSGRVLLVEDDPQVRQVSRDLLAAGGLDVVEAASGAEALERHDVGRFDVVVSDVVMPGMSGTSLVVALRLREPGLPIVLVSGYSDELADLREVITDPLQLVQKPYGPHALLIAVQAVLAPGKH